MGLRLRCCFMVTPRVVSNIRPALLMGPVDSLAVIGAVRRILPVADSGVDDAACRAPSSGDA